MTPGSFFMPRSFPEWATAFTIAATIVAGYAVLHHRMGEAEGSIEKLTTARDTDAAALVRVETTLQAVERDVSEVKADVKTLIRESR